MITSNAWHPGRLLVAGGLVLAGLCGPGCQKKLDPQEYGQVINGVPMVKGADRPYPLPQLEDPQEKQQAEEK